VSSASAGLGERRCIRRFRRWSQAVALVARLSVEFGGSPAALTRIGLSSSEVSRFSKNLPSGIARQQEPEPDPLGRVRDVELSQRSAQLPSERCTRRKKLPSMDLRLHLAGRRHGCKRLRRRAAIDQGHVLVGPRPVCGHLDDCTSMTRSPTNGEKPVVSRSITANSASGFVLLLTPKERLGS
jgi:hypothetical protein